MDSCWQDTDANQFRLIQLLAGQYAKTSSPEKAHSVHGGMIDQGPEVTDEVQCKRPATAETGQRSVFVVGDADQVQALRLRKFQTIDDMAQF